MSRPGTNFKFKVMRNNIGATDKIVRFTIAVTAGVLVFSRTVDNGLAALGLLTLAFCLVVTCIKGSCPLYRMLGINTYKNLNARARFYEFHHQDRALLKDYFKNYQEKVS